MSSAHALSFLAVLLQSTGKVMYGTFLAAIAPAQFLLISFCVVAGVFLVAARGRLPAGSRAAIVSVNVWTAVAFICFFFALKHLSPAAVGAIEIGVAVLVAVIAAAWRGRAPATSGQPSEARAAVERPSGGRPSGGRPSAGRPGAAKLVVCAGIVGGCALLVPVELERAAAASWHTVLALIAAAMAGAASTLIIGSFSRLADNGWRPASILAHRFYLTIAVALAWVSFEGGIGGAGRVGGLALPAATDALTIVAVAAIGVMLPLLLLQFAVRKTDALTLMICMALQPVLSFMLSMLSPAYDWQPVTLAGTLIVAGALLFDVFAGRKPKPAPARVPVSVY
jgi:drug/metabolite transporter (DMT)-like permease